MTLVHLVTHFLSLCGVGVYVHTFACVCLWCGCACACCLWRLDDNLGGGSLIPTGFGMFSSCFTHMPGRLFWRLPGVLPFYLTSGRDNPGVTDTQHHTNFMWVLGIWSHVVKLMWQVFHPALIHSPCSKQSLLYPKLFVHCMCVCVCTAVLDRQGLSLGLCFFLMSVLWVMVSNYLLTCFAFENILYVGWLFQRPWKN